MAHIATSLYPDIPLVFSNTGLEHPHIISHVRTHENVVQIRPKTPFNKVIEKYGWPVISKSIAMAVSRARNTKSSDVKDYRLNGRIVDGKKQIAGTIPKKWHFLMDTPFAISEQCCNHLKKFPFKKYEKESGRKPMIATMISDSGVRAADLNKRGCNVYDTGHPQSRPMAKWNEEDVWRYLRENNIKYCRLYDEGEKRTGCVFCMFGIMHDKDRFIRLKISSPVQYNYVINTLGGDKVLDYLGIKY